MVKRYTWCNAPEGHHEVVLATDYDTLAAELGRAKADADLRWENGFQNAKLQFEARIRDLEAKLQHWLNAYGSTDAISSDTRDLLTPSETACNHDLQSAEKTLKAIMDGSLNGFYCTVCNERWGFPVETSVDNLNLQPIGHCDKCGRKVWKASTLGQIDEMLQPGGGICGGRFVSDRGGK